MTPSDHDAFVRDQTRLGSTPLLPELRLHLGDDAIALWQSTEAARGGIALAPPFWAYAWAGGQALARHILDNPALVRGRSVLDLASGGGVVAIAAARAGAASVTAVEIDPTAIAAIRLNAAENGVAVVAMLGDLLAAAPPAAEIVTAGDVFYERPMAERVSPFLAAARDAGAMVLVGDPGRAYLPRDGYDRLAGYTVAVPRTIEDAEVKETAVLRLR